MLGGGWSSKGMITTLSNNRKLLRRKRIFKKEKSFLNIRSEYYKRTSGRVITKEASKEILEEIKKDYIKHRKAELAITILAVLTTICIFGYIFKNILDKEQKIEQNNLLIRKELNSKKYLKYIDEGDKWFIEKQWFNAIFKYKEALVLYPKDFEINYRLLQAYSYRCQYDLKDCFGAKALLEKLLKEFPEKNELHKFKNILDIEFSSSSNNKL